MELTADEDETYATRLLFALLEGAEEGDAEEDGALGASELLLGVLAALGVLVCDSPAAKALIDV